ncbi:hypothetical protein N431DRAFT_478027 [Stipitochalara longipes BDJ]|nr:hypothetical protein N431DRAFT_478027 [Stipitochalara longipes BDJ]
MNGSNQLDTSIFGGLRSGVLPEGLRDIIIEQFWGRCAVKDLDYNAYFRFHASVCGVQLPNDHAMKTYRDLLFIVHQLKQQPLETRADVRAKLCSAAPKFKSCSSAQLDKSLELVIRLWLMLSANGLGSFTPGQTVIYWPDDKSLTQVINESFPRTIRLDFGQRHFPPSLTIFNLVRFGGFQVKWTSNLVDHLLLNKQGQILVFHSVSVLQSFIESEHLPHGLADETLRTLAILFPRADIRAQSWLQRTIIKAADRHEFIDPLVGHLSTPSSKLSEFSYWRERLLYLGEAYDKSEPSTIWQWWHDRRNRREWATFWVAFLVLILTIVFGLIQSITGIVQAWASIKGLQLQLAAVNLN